MKVKIEKSVARGSIKAPSSKSAAHRMIIAAAMCDGQMSVISSLDSCEDILATIDCLRSIGVKIEYDGKSAKVWGIDLTKASATEPLNCRKSGSTLRFLIPLLWLSGEKFTLIGSERLLSRPLGVYESLAKSRGLFFERGVGELTVGGRLTAGEYSIPGNVSSQFISGLALALSTVEGDSKINITTELESADYVNLTLSVINSFGASAEFSDGIIYIKGGAKLTAHVCSVEGDWSNAAFLDAFNLVGGEVRLSGLFESSLQPDRVYPSLFTKLCDGAPEIDISSCPDLGPILFTISAIKNGGSFIGIKRLRDKESDRISAMVEELSKFGAKITVTDNKLTIEKSPLYTPSSTLFGHNDHRIVMSLAVISSIFGGEIEGAEAVNKSYPTFFEVIRELGISVK